MQDKPPSPFHVRLWAFLHPQRKVPVVPAKALDEAVTEPPADEERIRDRSQAFELKLQKKRRQKGWKNDTTAKAGKENRTMAHKAKKSSKKKGGFVTRLKWMAGIAVVFLIIAFVLWLLYGTFAAISAGCCGSILIIIVLFFPFILKKIQEAREADEEDEGEEEEEEEEEE